MSSKVSVSHEAGGDTGEGRDFPGGPFQSRGGVGLILIPGPTCLMDKTQNIKQKHYYKVINKTLNGPHQKNLPKHIFKDKKQDEATLDFILEAIEVPHRVCRAIREIREKLSFGR